MTEENGQISQQLSTTALITQRIRYRCYHFYPKILTPRLTNRGPLTPCLCTCQAVVQISLCSILSIHRPYDPTDVACMLVPSNFSQYNRSNTNAKLPNNPAGLHIDSTHYKKSIQQPTLFDNQSCYASDRGTRYISDYHSNIGDH